MDSKVIREWFLSQPILALNSDTRTSKRGKRKGKTVKTVRKDDKKARKNTKVLTTTSVTSAATATAANQSETPVSVSLGPILSTTVRSDGELPTHIPGWATVPPKLLKKIWNLEYVDMWELPARILAIGTASRGLLPGTTITKGPGDQSGSLDGVLCHAGSSASIPLPREDPPTLWLILEPSRGQVVTLKGQLGQVTTWHTGAKPQTRAPLIGPQLIRLFTTKPSPGGQGPFPAAASA